MKYNFEDCISVELQAFLRLCSHCSTIFYIWF